MKVKFALNNLLAIIHRDGGHHTSDVGEEQSVEDAHLVWAQLREENERLRAEAIIDRQDIDKQQAKIETALARIKVSIDGKPRGDSGYMQGVIDRFVLDLRSIEEALRGAGK